MTPYNAIHLTDTTPHPLGVGMYVDPRGWVWFTEGVVYSAPFSWTTG